MRSDRARRVMGYGRGLILVRSFRRFPPPAIDNIDPAPPMLKIDPALPMLRIEPALPTLRIEPALPMESNETTLKRLARLSRL